MPSAFDLLGFAAHLGAVGRDLENEIRTATREGAALIAKNARNAIGTYRYGWPQLADATQAKRARMGFSPNEPLKMTGALQRSIAYEAHGVTAYIGTAMKIGVYHEFGTRTTPARPFLGPAAAEAAPMLQKLAAAHFERALMGRGAHGTATSELIEVLHIAAEAARDVTHHVHELYEEGKR